MSESLSLELPEPAATDAFGRRLAGALRPVPATGMTLWLEGELGAGKTTLARACLRGLGHAARVPSPTYTLVEPYELDGLSLHHVDLYRLAEPGEAEFLGLSELPAPGGLLLVEWPERGAGHLPGPDLRLVLELAGDGRRLAVTAATAAGRKVLERLAKV